MKKIKNNQSIKDHNNEQRDKATTVFLKLYAKRKGKHKEWSDVRAETYPIAKEIKPGVDDV
jgi:hypothetical protein